MDTLSLPDNSTQSCGSISEFQLPNEVRRLAIRILADLFNQINVSLENAKNKLSASESEHDLKLQSIESKEGSFLKELNQIRLDAKAHLNSKKVEIPDNHSSVNHLSFSSPINGLHVSQNLLNELRAIEKPFLYSRTRDEFVDWGPTLFGYGVFILISTFLWYVTVPLFFCIFLFQGYQSKRIQAKYSKLYVTTQKIIDQTEKKINQARQEAEEAKKIARDNFGEEIKQIEIDFFEVAETLHNKVKNLWHQCNYAAADWNSPVWNNWMPDPSPEFAARIGVFTTKSQLLNEFFPKIDFNFRLPALLPFADGCCLAFQTTGKNMDSAAKALLSVMVRVLANTPAGKARFTFIDPVGLGQNVADFLHLGDFNKDLISGKAWSEPQHIEHQLTLLTENIETVIQTCLRKEFSSILDYNRERHEVAQPFRFLVVNDFPVNFTESSLRRLESIIKNGPRCGVFTFLLLDTNKITSTKFNFSEVSNAVMCITAREHVNFAWPDRIFAQFDLVLDELPPQSLINTIVKKSGELAISAMKVDVPFEKLLTAALLNRESWWNASTAENLLVPIGPAGARAIQELTLGGNQEAHALLVGRTGSGKTNLMHVIITSLALKYPAEEVQLYLIDFKGGVGFKRYAEFKLPHAKVIAIESEREFGMSVLRGLDAELKQRSEMFRAAGVDNLFTYRSKVKDEKPNSLPMPRILLIVDEFQEFFSENDDLAQQAKMIFERLARQGRSFGIHFLLATQSLSGSAQLPSSIMGQIKVRIALPCSESDSRLILADDNKAARALSLPGEGIYNPLGGLVEGNNHFHVARFSDDDLPKYLTAIQESVPQKKIPLIFEGNELAHFEECAPIKDLSYASNWPEKNKHIEIFLGEPIAIMPPVTARLRRQSGSNLLILCREEDEGAGMCISAFLSLAFQQSPEKRRIYLADFTTADSELAQQVEKISHCFPEETTIVRRQRDVVGMLVTIVKEIQSRNEASSDKCSIYLILQGIHRIKSLRDDIDDDDGNNAVELLKTILKDGPEVGVHVIGWADTWGNITRGLNRRSIGEFGLRVAGVMESGDSMNFLDNLVASKISKSHRAIFYDEDRPGQFIMFRPYKMPSEIWLQQTRDRLLTRVENRKTTNI